MDAINYRNQWALITGASAGIGESFAYKLAEKGSNLILVARREEKLLNLAKDLKNKYPIEVDVIVSDLSELSAPEELFNRISQSNRPVSILVNNAGVGTIGRLDETDLEKNAKMILLNVYSFTLLIRLFLPQMLKQKFGIIVNLASVAAFQPTPYMAAYSATKAYVLSLSEALWAEYKNSGIRILAVCPGPTRTEFQAVAGMGDKSFTERDNPEVIVDASFKALDKNKNYIIPGPFKNYLLAQMGRFVPRSWLLKIAEQLMHRQIYGK